MKGPVKSNVCAAMKSVEKVRVSSARKKMVGQSSYRLQKVTRHFEKNLKDNGGTSGGRGVRTGGGGVYKGGKQEHADICDEKKILDAGSAN